MAESEYIKVTPAELLQAADTIGKIAGVLDDRLDVLRNELQQLIWTDERAAELYRGYQLEWDTAVKEINNVLREVGVKCGRAGQNYIDTEFNVAGLWANR